MKNIFQKMDYVKIQHNLLSFIREKSGDKPVIIGLSGGIDSTITCDLAIKAKGPEKVKVLIIKNSRYLLEDLELSRKYVVDNGLERIEINSEEIRKQALLETKLGLEDVQKVSSLDARITDMIIRTFSDLEDRIYLGTINGTERLTGWYPKGSLFGDFCPIGGLLKSQVKELAIHLGLPKSIIDTIADDASKICSGCGELPEFKGIPYDVLDLVLYFYEMEKTQNIYKKFEEHNIPEKMYQTILKRIDFVMHKQDIFSPFPEVNIPHRQG